jgi:hypothetical protein
MSYNVILQGSFGAGTDPAMVRRKFMALTGQTESVTERLFSGRPTVIKRQLSQADAQRIVSALHAIGADASLQQEAAQVLELALVEPTPSPASDAPFGTVPQELPPLQEPRSQQECANPAPSGALSLQEPMQSKSTELTLQEPVQSKSAELTLQEPDGLAASDTLTMEESKAASPASAPAPAEAAVAKTALPPPPPLEEMYRAVIGPAHTDFYLRHFLRRDAGGPMLSWNMPAVLAQFFWSLHRKLWRFAVFGLALGLVVALLAGYFFSFATGVLATRADPILTQIASVLAGVLAGMIVGAFGNDAYQRRAMQLIKQTAHISDPARRLATLEVRGGTSGSWRFALAAAVVGVCAIAGVMLGLADSPSSAEAATPGVQRLPGSNLLSGRWHCTSQATGRITYWDYAANGAVSFYGENPQETVPLMGAEVPNRWRLQNNILHWTSAWHGSQWSADNAVLDLSREFMHYTSAGGESVVCARP